ncbi:MAG: heme-copper oxidase subunit III [Candidatus Krumholzibacteriia bacterium]
MSTVVSPLASVPVSPPRFRVASNAVVGTLTYVTTAIMFFGGLISAYIVLRAGSIAWPPPDQPRLPVAVTGINTAILLLSGGMAVVAAGASDAVRRIRWLNGAAVLGAAFVAVQSYEWVRLVHFGLLASSGTYGATFYTIVGAHAVHALGGLAALLATSRLVRKGRGDLTACLLYWGFVVLLWPVLYVLVYLV